MWPRLQTIACKSNENSTLYLICIYVPAVIYPVFSPKKSVRILNALQIIGKKQVFRTHCKKTLSRGLCHDDLLDFFCNHLKLQMMWHFLKGLSIEITFARGIWENLPSNHCRSSYQILNHISDHQMGTMQYQFCMCS